MRRAELIAAITLGLGDSGLDPDMSEPILVEAEEGNAAAQHIVGSVLEQAGLPAESVAWFRRAAQQGHLPAKERLRRLVDKAA